MISEASMYQSHKRPNSERILEHSHQWKEFYRASCDALHDVVVFEDVDGQGYKITLEEKEGKKTIVDFSTLCHLKSPDPVIFVAKQTWNAVQEQNPPIVWFSKEGLRDPRSIFLLLHELGHITQNDRNLERYSLPLQESFRTGRVREYIAYLRSQLRQERDAWAEGIRLARRIKDDHHIDLFALFENNEQFSGFIRSVGLRSYEVALEKQGISSFSKNNAVTAWETAQEIEDFLIDENAADRDIMTFALGEMIRFATENEK